MLRMKQRSRVNYSDEQKALMWDRWQKGDSMHQNVKGERNAEIASSIARICPWNIFCRAAGCG
jgi:hypothetical protein